MNTRSTGICMKSPASSFLTRMLQEGHSSPEMSTPEVCRNDGRRVCGIKCSGDSWTGQPRVWCESVLMTKPTPACRATRNQ